MKKKNYQLCYHDIIGRERIRKFKTFCIVDAMNEAKKFCMVNRISNAKLITSTGAEYYV